MPLRAALRSASRTAAGLTSTPYSAAQACARVSPMEPVPQYRSSSVSPGRSAASGANKCCLCVVCGQ